MKKFLSLLLFVAPALAFTACSDDGDSIPDVDFNFEFENVTKADGKLYVVQGETMEITSITVTNNEEGKKAFITSADYYWDYYYIGTSIQPPYGFEINIDKSTPVGTHALEVECPVYAVGKEPAFAVVSFEVDVVASADDLPTPTDPATATVHPRMTDTSKK